MKISTAILFVGSLAILAWRWRAAAAGWVIRTAPAALGIGLPWLARNVALSGCFMFPAAATCLVEEPWSVGPRGAQNLAAWITSWARNPFLAPEEVLGNWRWLRGWPDLYATDENRVLIALFALGLVLALAGGHAITRSVAIPFAIAVAGAAYWFLSAPAPRFGFGYLYPLALMPLAFALSTLEPHRLAWTRASAAVAILLACSATLRSNCGGLAASACTAFTAFTGNSGGWKYWRWIPYLEWPRSDFPVHLESRPMRSGQIAFVASPTKQQCWDHPLPCTPWLHPDLFWTGGRFEVRPAPSARTSTPNR